MIGSAGECGTSRSSRVGAGWYLDAIFNEESGCKEPAVLGGLGYCCGISQCDVSYGRWGLGWQFLSKDCKGPVLVELAGHYTPPYDEAPLYIGVYLEFFGPAQPDCERDSDCCGTGPTCSTCKKPLGGSDGGVGGSMEYSLSLGRTGYDKEGASLAI
jgi:hypothetical protein